jgi:hypothetical protein
MINVFINNLNYKINQYESIHSLKTLIQIKTKIDINNQLLYYRGKLLNDNISLIEYNINDHDILTMNHNMKGGNIDTLTILMWLLYFCALGLFLLILISGLIPVIANAYGYILHWMLIKIGYLLGMGNNKMYEMFVFTVMFIVSIFIVYYFVYATTSFIAFPLMYTYFDDLCKGIQKSNSIGWWVSIFFIIIYGLFNIPNFILNSSENMIETNFLLGAIINPFLGVIENFANIGKFAGLYAIPFLGTPFLEGYHLAVSLIATLTKNAIDMSTLFNCNDTESRKKLGLLLRNANKEGSPLRDWIVSYHAEKFMEAVIIGLIPEKLTYYECEVNKMPFWDKFGETAGKYYAAKYTSSGFCFALRFMKAISGVVDSIGGSSQLANMIRTGNIGGIISFMVFIICIILGIFNVI